MRINQVQLGMQVVMNDLQDAQVYRVKGVTGFGVALEYVVGEEVIDGGVVDACYCQLPTLQQLDNDKPLNT